MIVLAGLVGGILWNLLTWLVRPAVHDSSHALFGGLVGATVASLGFSGVNWVGDGTKLDGSSGTCCSRPEERGRILMHNVELALEAAWEILLVSLLLGGILPAVFALVSVRSPAGGSEQPDDSSPHLVAKALATLCFAVVAVWSPWRSRSSWRRGSARRSTSSTSFPR